MQLSYSFFTVTTFFEFGIIVISLEVLKTTFDFSLGALLNNNLTLNLTNSFSGSRLFPN